MEGGPRTIAFVYHKYPRLHGLTVGRFHASIGVSCTQALQGFTNYHEIGQRTGLTVDSIDVLLSSSLTRLQRPRRGHRVIRILPCACPSSLEASSARALLDPSQWPTC